MQAAFSNMAPVKLPQFVMLKGYDSAYVNCAEKYEKDHDYLCLNNWKRESSSTHEVFPVEDQENVVMIKSVAQGKFWRLSPNWIWSDRNNKPDASEKDCLFELYQISPTIVAMKCLGNNKFVGEYSADTKEHALNARFEDAYQKPVQFTVEEGLSARRVFDVVYMWDRLEKTDAMPLVLGKGQNFNGTNYLGDVSLSVTYAVTNTSTWSDSKSFTTGFSYSVSAGIPDLFDITETVSAESTYSTEMGAENSETVEVVATYTVKDVEPGVGVSSFE